MKKAAVHVIVPALMSMIFFAVALMPVQTIGCRNRGLLALLIASVSGLTALWTGIQGLNQRRHGKPIDPWLLLSTVILTIPVVGLLVMA